MNFNYKAYTEGGTVVTGALSAAGRREAADDLHRRGLSVIALREEKEKKKMKCGLGNRKTLASFASEWASLLEAGLPLTDAAELLKSGLDKKSAAVLDRTKTEIAAGRSVADSFTGTGAFPLFFCALLRVGEISGTLPEQLRLAADYYKKEDEFLTKMKTALSYPLFVLCFALLVFTVILTVILPSFATLFDALGIPFPPLTRAALAVGLFLRTTGPYLIVFLLAGTLAAILYFRTESGQKTKEIFLYRFFFVRRLLLIRFCHTLSALLKSGKPLSQALSDTADTIGNTAAARDIRAMKKKISKGDDFSRVLSASPFSTPALARMAKVGMESGRLPEFLDHAARHMAEETDQKLARLRRILEPALILFVGLLTALIIFSVMLPIFNAAGSVMAR